MILHLCHQNIPCLAALIQLKPYFGTKTEIPQSVAVAVFFGWVALKVCPAFILLGIQPHFSAVFCAFSVLKYASLYCFLVFSRLFFNSAKFGGQCRQERQEHLVHTAVFKASLVSLFTRQKEISTILLPLLLALEK